MGLNSIIIFGGGTSGWLSAAYLVKHLPHINITLIEDTTIGPIGVGEGTQPATAKFLHECGFDPTDWMKPSNAAFKHGVELTGWNDDPYFVDNDSPEVYTAAPNLTITSYFANKPYSDYKKWFPAYTHAKENLSPKLAPHLDINFNTNVESFGAVHFNASDIINVIKSKILHKITYVDTKITHVESSITGIEYLFDGARAYTADLYVDCSGFNSELLGNTLGVKYNSYKPWLLNDSAVAIVTQYTDPENECHPYTKATTMNAGWRWTIPTYNRIGNGYVYSSDYITAEEAEQELREALNEWDAPAKHLKMKCGAHDSIAVKNVVAVGLSGGFVEPLEATGITFTTAVITGLTHGLLYTNGNYNDEVKHGLNDQWRQLTNEIFSFVYAHYHYSTRNDTPYWKAVRHNLTDVPIGAKLTIEDHASHYDKFIFYKHGSMFSSEQWWNVIHASDNLMNKPTLTAKEQAYCEYMIEVQNKRQELATQLFPNHYKFLKEWYND